MWVKCCLKSDALMLKQKVEKNENENITNHFAIGWPEIIIWIKSRKVKPGDSSNSEKSDVE